MRYKASISYDGSHFYGFQRLNNGLGVQNELERVLSIIAKESVCVHGSGRTDREDQRLPQAYAGGRHLRRDTAQVRG